MLGPGQVGRSQNEKEANFQGPDGYQPRKASQLAARGISFPLCLLLVHLERCLENFAIC